MPRQKDQLGTLKFIAIGITLMVLVDYFVFDGKRSYIEELRTKPAVEAAKPPPVRVVPPDGKEYFEAPVEEAAPAAVPLETMEKSKAPDTPLIPKDDKKAAPKAFVPHGSPKIAIIIDDIGMDVKRSRQVIDLPAPLTLALLPYAPKVREMAVEAKAKGHTLIIHTPMEAEDATLNIGPGGMKSTMSAAEMDAAFAKMLASFDGYEGINNHMGSRLTQDESAMARIMATLAHKKLFFLDSKTSAKSVAVSEAAEAGVAFASRDVFLDHTDSAGSVNQALNYTAELAQRRGYAIAIGHPKDHTIAALKAWIPTLKDKGIELVAVKALLVKPTEKVVGKERMDPPVKPEDEIVGLEDNKNELDMFPAASPTGVSVTTEP